MPPIETLPDHLVSLAGYSKQRAALMTLVLNCAVETLQHAEAQLSANWVAFCEKKGARRKPRKNAKTSSFRVDENAITYELADYIYTYLRGLPPNHIFREVQFGFETPKKSKALAGAHRKRLDFRFEAFVPGGPEFVIEAKPLSAESDIEKRYLGEEGLERFLREEEPLTEEQLGGLLGYIPFADANRWREAIKQAIVSKQGCSEVVCVNLQPWSDTYSSRHARTWPTDSASCWILHMLVKHPPVPSA